MREYFFGFVTGLLLCTLVTLSFVLFCPVANPEPDEPPSPIIIVPRPNLMPQPALPNGVVPFILDPDEEEDNEGTILPEETPKGPCESK